MNSLTRTTFARSALACVLALVIPMLCAAQVPLPQEFPVSDAQLGVLGVTLQRLDEPAPIAGLGYPAKVVLQPNDSFIVSAPFAGVVDQVLVNGQEAVRQGQPLMRLISPDYGEAQLKLLEADNQARLSQRAWVRDTGLFKEGIIAQRRLQETESAMRADGARRVQAQTTLRLMGANNDDIKRVTDARAVDGTLILRARSDGFVVKVDLKTGQRVNAADTLAQLVNPKELWLDIQVPAGQAVPENSEITLDGRAAVARLQASGHVVGDAQTVTLRAKVIRGVDSLQVGEVVQARVPLSGQTGWVLPTSALTRQAGKSYVFLRTLDGFTPMAVSVINASEQSVQVAGALSPGNEVATSAVIALKAAWLGKGGGD